MKILEKTPAEIDKTSISGDCASSCHGLSSQLIRIQASLILITVVLAVHACALVAISLTDLPLWLQLLCAVLLFFHAAVYCQRWRKAPHYRLQRNQQQQWVLYKEGDNSEFILIKSCYYWSRYFLVFEVVGQHNDRYFYPVLPDSCCHNKGIDSDGFRHLRVVAKFLL